MSNVHYGPLSRYLGGITPDQDTDVLVATSESSKTLTKTTRRVFVIPRSGNNDTLITMASPDETPGVTVSIHGIGAFTSSKAVNVAVNGSTSNGVIAATNGSAAYYSDGFKWLKIV